MLANERVLRVQCTERMQTCSLSRRQETLTPESLRDHEQRTISFCIKIAQMKGDGDPYIFGKSPTLLDAHVLPFLCRLYDADRSDLVPQELQLWLQSFRMSQMWHSIHPDGSTLPPYA